MLGDILEHKLQTINKDIVLAAGLTGSYARNAGDTYSDIDIVCLLKAGVEKPPVEIELINHKYVVTSFLTREELTECLEDAESITAKLSGLRTIRILYDPEGVLAELKHQAQCFTWTDELQRKANKRASQELVGWVEEIHKALQGMISDNPGKMLNGLYGLTYGLFKVIRIQKGIILTSENSFYQEVIAKYPEDSKFVRLSEQAFGITNTKNIRERVYSGLLLFLEVCLELESVIRPEDEAVIALAKAEIIKELKTIEV